MKKIVFTLLISFVAIAASAQFTFGPKAALNFSSFSANVDSLKSNMKPGFDAGVFVRVGIGKLYVQPEVLYSFKTTKITTIAKDIQMHSIDVPVLVGYKLLGLGKVGNIRAFVGPKFSAVMSDGLDATFASSKFNYAGQAGLGIDLLKVTIDLRYDVAFSDIATRTTIDNVKEKLRTNVFVVSLGWKIL